MVGGTYQLNVNSVNPTRVVAMDEAGMPIEETYPAAFSRLFVGLDGCVKDVPMRTAAKFSMEPEAERYEQVITREIVKDGQLPLDACPYTGQYKYITGIASLVKVPPGAEDCGGKPTGCEHMQGVIVERQKRARAKHDKIQEQAKTMKVEDVERMQSQMADAIGAAISRSADPKANRANLRAGKGEE